MGGSSAVQRSTEEAHMAQPDSSSAFVHPWRHLLKVNKTNVAVCGLALAFSLRMVSDKRQQAAEREALTAELAASRVEAAKLRAQLADAVAAARTGKAEATRPVVLNMASPAAARTLV